nr:protein dispatched [Leptinotarsa decemlineata]
MNLSWFANILVHHPFIILSAVAVFSGTCIVIPFTLKSVTFPSFQDPQLGFSTRGTTISNRLTTWANLIKSTRPSGDFTTNPKEYLKHRNRNHSSLLPKHKSKPRNHNKPKETINGTVYGVLVQNIDSSDLDEQDRWKALQNLTPKVELFPDDSEENFFCGSPALTTSVAFLGSYVSSVTAVSCFRVFFIAMVLVFLKLFVSFVTLEPDLKKNLPFFTEKALLILVKRLEHELLNLKFYDDLCIQNTKSKRRCCKPWSLPNYIALFNKRTSCLAITEEDVTRTKQILVKCAQYFHALELNSECLTKTRYCEAPIECLRHDAVFNILNFLTSTSFLPENNTEESSELKEVMIFLPLASSTAILPYYHELEKLTLEYDGIKVVAMDFGIAIRLSKKEFLLCVVNKVIFAGTAVVANYFLMMTWFPACLVIWERSCFSNDAFFRSCFMVCYQRWCCIKPQWNLSAGWCQCLFFQRFWKAKEKWLLDFVIRFKFVWFLLLFTIAIMSGFIVLVYPKLHLPNTNEFQLFATSHPFEQYDFRYKTHFWFNRPEKLEQASYKLPLRFVWGVLPIDNGDHLDPSNLGSLTLDPTFDVSEPESQEWLLNFCQKLRQQPFYQSMLGPLLPNCFIETFMKSMERKCYDSFTSKDRSPCCKTSKFPFNRSVFNECIIDEIADIYETPIDLLSPGMAGPKFSKDQTPTIKAVIVEYDSNYSYSMSYEQMNEFFNRVEDWMTEELKTAPDTMKNGWFISELEFYDLQRELSVSTEIAVVMSMSLALVVLFFSTLNILTSLYAIITITSSIFVTMAVLVMLGWKLNILESTAVSTAIGLTVDFSLHYSVNYRMCPETIAVDREAATRHALSYMAGPAFMAAITTGAAGAFMLPSLILPYIQIGIFLVLVMCVSWIYATFLLGSLLAIIGPPKNCGQFKYSRIISCLGKSKRVQERPLPTPSIIPDSHELEALTFSKRDRYTPKTLRRSLSSGGARFTPSKYVFTDQSPSATSAITIIMADDN